MKISAAAAAVLLMASVDAFTPSPILTQRTAQTSLSLLPDPVALTSAIQTSSFVVTLDPAEALGQLALLSSVGFGVAYSNANNKDWSYEYKVDNDYSDLAVLGESADSVREKVRFHDFIDGSVLMLMFTCTIYLLHIEGLIFTQPSYTHLLKHIHCANIRRPLLFQFRKKLPNHSRNSLA